MNWMLCPRCDLPDPYCGGGDGLGSCACSRCDCCGAGPDDCDCEQDYDDPYDDWDADLLPADPLCSDTACPSRLARAEQRKAAT